MSRSSGSPGSSRFQQQQQVQVQTGASLLQSQSQSQSSRARSWSLKTKPPEPLRRAVADCLASSSPTLASSSSSDAATNLRHYLADSSTTDLSYNLIVEHALAERERSPAVLAKCVGLLKRYLLRYIPSEQTLHQIDQFCVSSIFECDFGKNQRAAPWSKSSSQQSGASMPLPASSFASNELVKSLRYVRSLVAKHNPKQSFQPSNLGGASASKQALPTLSSLLSKSFNSPLSPTSITKKDSPERQETPYSSVSCLTTVDTDVRREDVDYIPVDVLTWRWPDEQQLPLIYTEIDGVLKHHDVSIHGFLELGAAALLVGDMETKIKNQPLRSSGSSGLPEIDQLLQPSTLTTATNMALAHSHLRVITTFKRTKPGPNQVWEDLSVSTFHPRSRPLFQYRPYSEQQPLKLNPEEVQEVIAAVCSETFLTQSNLITVSSRPSNNNGRPSMDAAVSVLIKLVIDMYVLDPQTATPLTLSMLEEMLSCPRLASKVRAFDLIINLGVHAHLLEPMLPDDPPIMEEESPQDLYLGKDGQVISQVKKNVDPSKQVEIASAIDRFESWLLNILYEILLLLVQTEEDEETVWASALSCLLYFVCDRGRICRNRVEGLDIRVIKALLVISRENSWAELVHSKLICMLANKFYHVSKVPGKTVSSTTVFCVEQVDLLGGIAYICLEYSQAKSTEEKRNLFLVLFDYALHQINGTCLAAGDSEYSFDEIQPIATILAISEAPEAFSVSVKHGVQGIGGLLRETMSAAFSRHSNTEQLNMLWKKIINKLETIISSFSHLDEEFLQMIQTTKAYNTTEIIGNGALASGISNKAKLSWATLHSLLHSERIAYRQNGYVWLVELLLAEISKEKEKTIWSSFRNLQRQIGLAGNQEYSVDSEVSLPIWILCGLLKSKHNFIRWGFLFVVEKLLMRCKLLLDEDDVQIPSSNDSRLTKANSVIDIMSSALSLVAQINETDRINILKMCDMLFSQLCLRLFSSPGMSLRDETDYDSFVGCMEEIEEGGHRHVLHQEKIHHTAEFPNEVNNISTCDHKRLHIFKTTSLAALLLHGQAIVPMQLVAHVPTALLYWPLIQLAGAAADDIALGVAVGSEGRGNLHGATSDIRAALLLLLIGKCTADSAAFQEVGGEEFFRELLDDTDSRVAYYCSAFLLKRMMTEEPEKYQRILQSLIFRAQQSNNEKLLENPYLQIRGILQLSSDLGAGL